MWTTGRGPEPFCGVTMLAMYNFGPSDQLCMVAFVPDEEDRERLSPLAVNTLGWPDNGNDLVWTIGDVEVKVASVVAVLTHRKLFTG
jgi:hypothetical protein